MLMELLRFCEEHAQDDRRLTPRSLKDHLQPHQYVGGPGVLKSHLFAHAVSSRWFAKLMHGHSWPRALHAMFEHALWCFASMDGHWPDASSMRGGEHLHARLMCAGFRPWDPSGTSDSAVRQQRPDAWKNMSQSSEVQADPTPPSRPLHQYSACKTISIRGQDSWTAIPTLTTKLKTKSRTGPLMLYACTWFPQAKTTWTVFWSCYPSWLSMSLGTLGKHCILPWPQSLREHTLCFAGRQPTADWLPWDLSRHE